MITRSFPLVLRRRVRARRWEIPKKQHPKQGLRFTLMVRCPLLNRVYELLADSLCSVSHSPAVQTHKSSELRVICVSGGSASHIPNRGIRAAAILERQSGILGAATCTRTVSADVCSLQINFSRIQARALPSAAIPSRLNSSHRSARPRPCFSAISAPQRSSPTGFSEVRVHHVNIAVPPRTKQLTLCNGQPCG